MTRNLTLNPNLVAKSYDSDKDGIVSDNLKINKEAESISNLL